jgi:tryptophan synthase alpha chain
LSRVLGYARGFVYYVSITGVTGTRSASTTEVTHAVERIRRQTRLPIAVGFGVKTPEQAAAVARTADAAVVGSALVAKVAEHLDASGASTPGMINGVITLVTSLAQGVRTVSKGAVA